MADNGGSSSPVSSAFTRALKGVQTSEQDAAAVALARRYARMIDADPDTHLWRLGPRLLDVLVELGMTPKARAAVVAPKGEAEGDGAAKRPAHDELRAKRATRKHTS